LRGYGKNFLAQLWHRQNGTIRNDMEQCGTIFVFPALHVYGKKIPETVLRKTISGFSALKKFWRRHPDSDRG
jgi:hypothetical protein